MIFHWATHLLSAGVAAGLLVEDPRLHNGGWLMWLCLVANLQCAWRGFRG